MARGQQGKGNISAHSLKEKRYVCAECGQTFSATKGTIFYRLRTNPATVMLVLALVAYGCPVPAIVNAFGFDERTVRDRCQRAGVHCQSVHEHLVNQRQLDLQQVQADEIKVKRQNGSIWMAMVMMVSSRLWLGGGSHNCRHFIFKQDLQTLVEEIGIEIRIAHYPPYCSKYNPIEHHLFPHVTRACQGVIFHSVELVQQLMARTQTQHGLRVTVNLLDKVYETGRKATESFRQNMPILFDDLLPQWNYRAVPQTI